MLLLCSWSFIDNYLRGVHPKIKKIMEQYTTRSPALQLSGGTWNRQSHKGNNIQPIAYSKRASQTLLSELVLVYVSYRISNRIDCLWAFEVQEAVSIFFWLVKICRQTLLYLNTSKPTTPLQALLRFLLLLLLLLLVTSNKNLNPWIW